MTTSINIRNSNINYMLYRFNRYIVLLLIFILVFSLTNCAFFNSLSGPIPIEFHGYLITLSWDAEDSGLTDLPSDVDFFNLYYRDLGLKDWNYLKSTEDSEKIINIRYNSLGDGDYEFGVQAVYNKGSKSEIHSSSDFSAWPSGGWYLKWRI